MPEMLIVEPVFAERLWAGTTLRAWFGASVPEGLIGECWAVSGMEGMSGTIRGGESAGLTLREAWSAGLVSGRTESGDFPLLCKFLDPRDWLSVQVHPNDAQAQELEQQPRGKAECWLVVSCEDGAALILGHRADTAEALRSALADGTLMDLLTTIPVAQDDFFMVGAGEVHSVGPGMLIYEVQQSSDTTYRLYDFDRVGPDGHTRELHVDKGFGVVVAPHDPTAARTAGPWEPVGQHARRRVLVDRPQFLVQRWETQNGHFTMQAPGYRVLTIVGGHATLTTAEQSLELGLGSSAVIPAGTGAVEVVGDVILITTDPGPKLG